ncbi:MAG: hypothetical protein Q4G07_07500 [Oscillospiraceae bacterium]|nr:hypothetical protein [Oscillospiraceae bacterium]
MNDTEMLGCLCEDADMGRSSARRVLKHIKDTNLSATVKEQLDDFEHAYDSAAQMLSQKGQNAPTSAPMAKTMAAVESEMQTFMDSSSSKIAEMMIQGNTMGITTITKQLNDYNGEDPEVSKLSKKQIGMEQRNIENLKKFL